MKTHKVNLCLFLTILRSKFGKKYSIKFRLKYANGGLLLPQIIIGTITILSE